MAEIPSWMWITFGTIITGFSVFMGYIKPVDHYAFFRLMLWVGLVMVAFGGLKVMLNRKTKQDLIDEMRSRHMQRGPGEVELRQANNGYPSGYNQPRGYTQQQQQSIPQMHPNQHGQNITHRGQHHSYPSGHHQQHYPAQHSQQSPHSHHQAQHSMHAANQHSAHPQYATQSHHQAVHHRQANNVDARFCGNCGTPLLKGHKFCPMCGGRV